MAEIQEFFTSRKVNIDGSTYLGELGRLWYDSATNTIRVGNDSPGGIIISAAGGGGAETDPVFLASPAGGITSGDINNWDTAYNSSINLTGGTANQILIKQSGTAFDYTWGSETDPVFIASPAGGIVSGDITNWDTAYNSSINLSGGTANQVLVKQSGTSYDYAWEDMIVDSPTYTKLVDDASQINITYVGEAVPLSLTSQAVWRIQKITLDISGNVDSIYWADSGAFSQVWDDRLSLTYS